MARQRVALARCSPACADRRSVLAFGVLREAGVILGLAQFAGLVVVSAECSRGWMARAYTTGPSGPSLSSMPDRWASGSPFALVHVPLIGETIEHGIWNLDAVRPMVSDV
jgi:hypothetical protein